MSLTIHTLKLDLGMKLMTELSLIDRFDASWATIEKREAASLKQLKSIATVRSVGASTRIEGSRMTDDEVAVLIENLSISRLEERDAQEVMGYFEALDTIIDNFELIRIAEGPIKNLHKVLMQHGEKDDWHRGNYKQVRNAVEASLGDGTKQLVFRTAEPGIETQDAMHRLLEWYEADQDTIPIVKVALFVYEFLSIHPFQDGNGRLSRVLTTLLLVQAGYVYVPYSSLESVIELNKESYYLALRQTQGTIRTDAPNWQPWLLFFLRSLAEQVRRLEKKVEREKIVLAALPELSLQIVEFAREHGRVTMMDAIKVTGSSRNTLKQHFRDLTERNFLEQHGSGRGVWYGLK